MERRGHAAQRHAWTRNSWWTATAPSSAWRTRDSSSSLEKSGRDLSDREASYVAAQYLREQLEQEDERPLYDVSAADVARIIGMLGIQ